MAKNPALNIPLKKYLEEVKDQVNLLWKLPTFINWREGQKLKAEDLIVINNSFLLRTDKKTSKNERYLCLKMKDDETYEIMIVRKKINTDFKKISSKSKESYELTNIEEEINEQFNELGKLVFILIGKKTHEEIIKKEIYHKSLKKITWDLSINKSFILDKANLSIKDPYSIGFLPSLYQFLSDNGIDSATIEKLSNKIEKGIKFLKKKAKTILEIPENNDFEDETLLSNFYKSIDSELKNYEEIKTNIVGNINEVLRISYNFLGDGIMLLKLIDDICDLKPLILWGTIYYHFLQNQKLMDIPSLVPGRKVDLKRYDEMIRVARNNSFHKITDFKRTLQIKLPEDAIKSTTLTIFSLYSDKSGNKLTYKDKEIVDVLKDFYRTEEIILPDEFWEKNYGVMKATNDIFKATSKVLRILVQKE
ncbi:hypothetical protein LCGC14_2145310 [marine sediment metagenome]|uniref:Uncharacterized protein n=1 Tax=marine sediment metagenome TaxID=412755 RepID=A0A0F9GA70_9ZZZZ